MTKKNLFETILIKCFSLYFRSEVYKHIQGESTVTEHYFKAKHSGIRNYNKVGAAWVFYSATSTSYENIAKDIFLYL